jgi:hypothetical protein
MREVPENRLSGTEGLDSALISELFSALSASPQLLLRLKASPAVQ